MSSTTSTDSAKQQHDLEEQLPVQNEKRLLSWMLSKDVPPVPLPDERGLYPLHRANPISRMMFWWLFPVMNKGYKRTLQPDDLWIVEGDMSVEEMADAFYRHLYNHVEKARTKWEAKRAKKGHSDDEEFKWPRFSIVLALLKTFRWQYLRANIWLAMSSTVTGLTPLLSKELITFVEKRALGIEEKMGKGIGMAIGTFFLIYCNGLFINHFFHNSMLTGAQCKAILTKVILDKSFKLNSKAKHDFPPGKITSLMGTDLARIDLAIGFQPFVLTFPIPIIISVALLVHNIGVAALTGIGLFLLSIFLIGGSTKSLFAFRKKVTFFTDKRVSYMREVLNSMKVIKYYAWESAYERNIADIRKKEMKVVLGIKLLRNFLTSYAISLPSLTSMLSFCVMYALNRGQNPADIFSSVSLFGVLSQAIMLVPIALASGADALIGLDRVREYLSAEEESAEEANDSSSSSTEKPLDKSLAIKVSNGTFKWDVFYDEDEENEKNNELNEMEKGNFKKAKKKKLPASLEKKKEEQQKELAKMEKKLSKINTRHSNLTIDLPQLDPEQFPGLVEIDLEIKKEEFVIITGLIGSGKSSLLAALSGFMSKKAGTVDTSGSLLLCGIPWVQNATVRENILFGQPFDEKKYQDVIYACALEADLDLLPAGDKTEIGERGITLSGGQKARINLARAVYNNPEIILLDDVLSAVDARVGKHIMDNCLLGLLKGKTRILATHQLSLIGSADRVIFLNGDGSIDVDTVEKLTVKNANFQKLMQFNSELKDGEDEENDLEDPLEADAALIKQQTINEEEIRTKYQERNEDGKLMSQEDKAVNGISWDIYKTYINLGSGFFGKTASPIFVVCVIISTFCQLFTNTWLSFWTEKKFEGRSDGFYIGLYIMFTFLSVIFITIEFGMLAYMTNVAAEKLNIGAVQKILHAPMSFMDTTPMGRILNRFTKDTDSLDNEISEQLRLLFFPLSTIIGVLILCIIYLPWFAIAVPFLIAMFVAIANYYQASSREIKRLEAVQRSFVYNNFNETLSGMNTIKAYKRENAFVEKSNYLINRMNEAYFITVANQRWLSIHLDLVASVFVLIIALLCVTRTFHINASSTGLLLSYVMQIVGLLSLFIRSMTQVENEMNSVERICHYAYNLPQEADYLITEKTPAPSWPEHGTIEFNNASMAYREGLPLVLKNLNLNVQPSEKIGICGRTGAGKSSIMTALYRLSELSQGSIVIDGLDIASLGLYDLRSKLSIIPQDPVLFQGTIRKNLDPFSEHEDVVLWDALRRSGLIEASQLEKIKQTSHKQGQDALEDLHKFHLDQLVEDEGANFSLGERQLIALARALVRNSKILILDEATSSVDYETDSKIQSTIVNEFGNCTILCIAHRLKTILNYDRILVLDKGEVSELDTPWKLFNIDGVFKQMCERSNIVAEDFSRRS